MQRGYAPEWVLSGSHLIRGSNPDLIMSCIDALGMDSWKSHLVTQDASIVPGGVFTDNEKWYGTEYHVEKVSPALLQVCVRVPLAEIGVALMIVVEKWPIQTLTPMPRAYAPRPTRCMLDNLGIAES